MGSSLRGRLARAEEEVEHWQGESERWEHLWGCAKRLLEASDARNKARAEREAASAFRPRPPTPQELRAHHTAHAVDGASWWIRRLEGGLDFEEVLGEELDEFPGLEFTGWPGTEWRPATCEGVACEWPACGGPEPTGEPAAAHDKGGSAG